MARTSIAELRRQMRSARRLIFLGETVDGRWRWTVTSTDGAYKHRLEYDPGREDVVCLACEGKYGENRCWARARALDWLKERSLKGDAVTVLEEGNHNHDADNWK